jgi:hypothetical protein
MFILFSNLDGRTFVEHIRPVDTASGVKAENQVQVLPDPKKGVLQALTGLKSFKVLSLLFDEHSFSRIEFGIQPVSFVGGFGEQCLRELLLAWRDWVSFLERLEPLPGFCEVVVSALLLK